MYLFVYMLLLLFLFMLIFTILYWLTRHLSIAAPFMCSQAVQPRSLKVAPTPTKAVTFILTTRSNQTYDFPLSSSYSSLMYPHPSPKIKSAQIFASFSQHKICTNFRRVSASANSLCCCCCCRCRETRPCSPGTWGGGGRRRRLFCARSFLWLYIYIVFLFTYRKTGTCETRRRRAQCQASTAQGSPSYQSGWAVITRY